MDLTFARRPVPVGVPVEVLQMHVSQSIQAAVRIPSVPEPAAISRFGHAALEQRIQVIFQTRIRFVYDVAHVLPKREGWQINSKKTCRIYRGIHTSSSIPQYPLCRRRFRR